MKIIFNLSLVLSLSLINGDTDCPKDYSKFLKMSAANMTYYLAQYTSNFKALDKKVKCDALVYTAKDSTHADVSFVEYGSPTSILLTSLATANFTTNGDDGTLLTLAPKAISDGGNNNRPSNFDLSTAKCYIIFNGDEYIIHYSCVPNMDNGVFVWVFTKTPDFKETLKNEILDKLKPFKIEKLENADMSGCPK